MRFLDTNVLLYAAGRPAEEASKRHRALELLSEPEMTLSVQVLQEFYHQATRPTRPLRLSSADALRFLEPLLDLPVQAMTLDVFRRAVADCQRFRLSYWDAAILAAARAAGCDAVYSEDMSAGQDYDGLLVLNPFTDEVA